MATVLNQVRTGMRVCDPSGAEIGTVEFVKLTDEDPSVPGAETASVSPAVLDENRSLVDVLAEAFRADEVPEVVRDRLLRSGFVRVDADGLFAADRYVTPDQIQSVSGDRVILRVGKDDLITRS